MMSGTLIQSPTEPQQQQVQQIYLWPLSWEAWQAAHDLRLPAHDFTDYSIPPLSPEAEFSWWHEQVDSGQVLVMGIFSRQDDHLLGTLKAFDFNPERTRCEIGIEVLQPEDYGQGLGRQGLSLWLAYLQAQGVCEVYGLIHPDNQRSRHLFSRLQFSETGLEQDPMDAQMTFVRVEKQLS